MMASTLKPRLVFLYAGLSICFQTFFVQLFKIVVDA